jgi:hypothetical protein
MLLASGGGQAKGRVRVDAISRLDLTVYRNIRCLPALVSASKKTLIHFIWLEYNRPILGLGLEKMFRSTEE